MAYETILYDEDGALAVITLNRPDKLNSFNETMHRELADALSQVEAGGARCLLLTGAGRGFCAGQDLGDRAVSPGGAAVDLGQSLESWYNPLIRRLRRLEMPVVCAVNGVAAGAGMNVALAADIVLAARGAKFVQPFCNLGLVPDSGGSWILPRLVGPARAAGLAMLGDKLTADQARDWGLIWAVHDDDALPDAARKLGANLATQPTAGLAKIKRALRLAWSNDLDAHLDLERDLQREAGFSDDYKEGVAAFMDKRAPTFTGK